MNARDAFDFVAEAVGDSGFCADTESGKTEIIKALNLAQEAMIKRLDAKNTLTFWQLPVVGGCFPLPWDVEGIRSGWLDGQTLTQRDEWWEGKLGVGLADRSCCWNQPWIRTCRGIDLVDLGTGFATPNPWPQHANTKIALVAESENDAGKIVQVRYYDSHNIEHEEFITLLGDLQPAVSSLPIREVTYFQKPVTQGGVKMYVRYDTIGQFAERGIRVAFAYYTARETTANFHRMKLPPSLYGRTGCCGQFLIKGKRKFMPIVVETDPLQITDRQALIFGVQAIAAAYRKAPDEYQSFLANAVNELERQKENSVSPAATAQAQFNLPRSAFRRHAWN